MPGGDGAHEGSGIVLDFLHHGLVRLAEESDGVGGSGVGAGGHRGDVSGFEDKDAGGASARAGRGDVDDDGNRGRRKLFDDVASGIDEPAGRIEFDEDGFVVIGGGGFEGASDVFGGDGLDGVVDDDFQDLGGGG